VRFTPRRAIGAIAGSLMIAGLAIVPNAKATESFALDRVAGADRYETAAAIAQLAFPSGADAIVLARGDDYPDALAGSYLTGVLGAPILLTKPAELPDVTKDAIEELGATTVYLLGGTGAISQAVEDELKADHTVTRIAGNDRYETAADVATSQDDAGVGETAGGATAFLASGRSFADALAAGPLAHAAQLPILLTDPAALPGAASSALTDLGIEHVVVLGGTAAVSSAVVDDVEDGGVTTERVAGQDRYETAAAIADFALDQIPDWSNDSVDLATGTGFADALAAGPAAGEDNRSILLTTPAALSAPTSDWLFEHAGTLQDGRVYGGTAAVTDGTVESAEAAGQGETGGALEGQLTFIDKDTDFYRFVPDGADDFETVEYDSGDTFTVNGVSATIGGFEGAATPGDTIRSVPAAGSAAARHELTNVDPASITEGTVGNVDIANTQLDIVNAVSGDALVADIDWSSKAYEVDGATADADGFADDVNEGDEISLATTGDTTTFSLTNVDVEGPASEISSAPLPPSTSFKIGQLGDDPADDQDDTYVADGNPISGTDEFVVDGDDTADYGAFSDALTDGDVVTYTREGGVQHFELVNTPPTTQTGQAVDDLTTDGDGNPITTPDAEDGGSFTLATETGTYAVAYGPDGTFVVNGSIANEEEFEAAYSAGDNISFRPADEPSGTTQRIEVDDQALAGAVDPDGVDTANDAYDVLAANGETVLATVTYVGDAEGDNTYFVNGSAATLEGFEDALESIADGTNTGDVVVTAGDVTQHKLTTTAAA
jgi:putative cell wall-binding protein